MQHLTLSGLKASAGLKHPLTQANLGPEQAL